jgi:hypothetical protein
MMRARPSLLPKSTGGRPFNPTTLFAGGTLGSWYDPTDLTTMFQDTAGTQPVTATGQRVALLRDKGPSAIHLSQATSAARPIYQVDASNRPYLLFDGVDERMSSASAVSGTLQTLFVGVITTTNGMVFNTTVGANDRLTVRTATTGTPATVSYYNGAATGKSGSGAATAQLVVGTVNKTGPVITCRLNGSDQVGTTAVTPTATVGTSLGGSTAGTLFFGGSLYCAVMIARALTTAERARLETYLGARMGLVL